MSDTKAARAAEARRQRNAEIVDAIRAGAPLQPAFSLSASAFPPRPVIQKDKREMARLLGQGNDNTDAIEDTFGCKKTLIER